MSPTVLSVDILSDFGKSIDEIIHRGVVLLFTRKLLISRIEQTYLACKSKPKQITSTAGVARVEELGRQVCIF